MSRRMRLLAVLLFYLLNVWLVVAFSATTGVLTYPLIIAVSVLFIGALQLQVPRRGLIEGGLFAAIAMGTIIVVLLASGAIAVGPIRDDFSYYLLIGVVLQLLVGFGEELAFRASIFQGLYRELGLWPAVALSAAGFAALHIPSLGYSDVGVRSELIALATIFLAGTVLALIYHFGGLLNAVSFHFVWNFIEYNLFSMGPPPMEGAIAVSKAGSELLTGSAFGPEASIITPFILVLLASAVWFYYTKVAKPEGAQNISP